MPFHRIAPTHQRFGPDDPAVAQIDLRLEVHAELVLQDGITQLAKQQVMPGEQLILVSVVDRPALRVFACLQQRLFGLFQQGGRILAMLGEHRQTKCELDVQRQPRLVHGDVLARQIARQRRGVNMGGVGAVSHRELVAAYARQHPVASNDLTQLRSRPA